MLNGKLCVDLIKPFFIFKNNQDLVNVPFETIENPEYAMVGATNGDLEHWFLKWSGWADSNCRPRVPETRTLPTELHPDCRILAHKEGRTRARSRSGPRSVRSFSFVQKLILAPFPNAQSHP